MISYASSKLVVFAKDLTSFLDKLANMTISIRPSRFQPLGLLIQFSSGSSAKSALSALSPSSLRSSKLSLL